MLNDAVDDRPLTVFFEKPKCHDCEHFWEHILSDRHTLSLLDHFRVLRFELPSRSIVGLPGGRQLTVDQWARELNVVSVPLVVIFDGLGNEIRRAGNHRDPFRFQSLLNYVASEAYQTEPSFVHYLSHRTRHLHDQGDFKTHVH